MTDILITRIQERLETLGKYPQPTSLEAGFGRTYLADLLKGKVKSPTAGKLEQIAKVLETTPQYLLGDTFTDTQPMKAKTLPVLGRAAASNVGAENIITEAVEFTGVPPGLEGVRDAYCLWVEGESMRPLFKPRDPIFVHPRQPYTKGDIVLIQEERDGAIYASVKEYVRKTDTHLITQQYNEAAVVKFALKYVLSIHRVLPMREVLGM